MRSNTLKLCVLVLAALVTSVLALDQEVAAPKPPEKFVLTCHSVYGEKPREWVFVLKTPGGGLGISSVEKLHPYIELKVSKGSTLEWMPSDTVIGGEPLRTKKEQDDLAEFCSKLGIKFVIIPAG